VGRRGGTKIERSYHSARLGSKQHSPDEVVDMGRPVRGVKGGAKESTGVLKVDRKEKKLFFCDRGKIGKSIH